MILRTHCSISVNAFIRPKVAFYGATLISLTIAIQWNDISGLEYFDKETIVVEIDSNGEHPIERSLKLYGLLVLQTLHVELVYQALGCLLKWGHS